MKLSKDRFTRFIIGTFVVFTTILLCLGIWGWRELDKQDQQGARCRAVGGYWLDQVCLDPRVVLRP